MTAFNVVRFRVKPGREGEFLAAHAAAKPRFAGLRRACIVQTGETNFCVVFEWSGFERIVAARPKMIAMLDSFRHLLDDLGNGLGLTDPVSGSVVLELVPTKKAKAAKPAKKVKPARKSLKRPKAAKPRAKAKPRRR